MLIICFAPKPLRIGIYSVLLTVQIGVMFSETHNLISIRPSCEAAAVMIHALALSSLARSTKPRAVIGLTIEEAPSSRETPSPSGKHYLSPVITYSAIEPPIVHGNVVS